MIVDTMTLQEVGEAILKASRKAIPTIERMLTRKENDYKKVIYKGVKDRYDFIPLTFKTDGIEFILCPYSKGKKDFKKYGMMYCLFAHVYYERTNWYCMVTSSFQTVQMYSNHFFERFVERHLKDDTKVSVDLVRKYFKETNYLTSSRFIDNPKYENCMYGATCIGVCCGHKVSDHVLAFRTYIDIETLTKGDKKVVFDEGQKDFEAVFTNEVGLRGYWMVA